MAKKLDFSKIAIQASQSVIEALPVPVVTPSKDGTQLKRVALNQLHIDPTQPRRSSLTAELVQRHGHDSNYSWTPEQKLELLEIQRLAENIDQHGLIQPPVGYWEGEEVVLLVGARRYLAHIYLGRSNMEVLLRPRPDETATLVKLGLPENEESRQRVKELLLLDEQVIENLQRKDLSLKDYLLACQRYQSIYQQMGLRMTGQTLAERLQLSRSQSYEYFKILNANEPLLWERIEGGEITSLAEAVRMLAELEKTYKQEEKEEEPPTPKNESSKPGRKVSTIKLGTLKERDKQVVVKILSRFTDYGITLENTHSLEDLNQIWSSLLDKLSKEI